MPFVDGLKPRNALLTGESTVVPGSIERDGVRGMIGTHSLAQQSR